MFVKRVDNEEGRRLEEKQQIIIILSFPAHREVSRGIVNWCFGASTIRSKHRISDAPYGLPEPCRHGVTDLQSRVMQISLTAMIE
jgi:hypothetical protein